MEQDYGTGVHVKYFVRNYKRGIAHLTTGTRAEVLRGNYRTLCGQKVNPKKWILVQELQPKHYLCKGCSRKEFGVVELSRKEGT